MEVNYQKLNPTSTRWLFMSLISCILFGVGSFLIGLNSLGPSLAKFIVSLGYLISSTLSLLYSKLFHPIPTDLKPEPGFIHSAFSGSLNHFGNFCLFLAFHYEPYNQGIISITLIATAAVSATASYFIFNEKLAAFDILGMTICISGLVTIGIFSNKSSSTSLLGFYFALSAVCFYTIRNLFIRKAQIIGINTYKSTVVSLMFEGLTGVLNIFVIGIFIDVFKDSQNFWLTLVGGVLLGLGSFAINLAIMEGKIGPAMVICNCNGILQMVFDFGFRDFVPETGKLAGGVVAIVGAAILLLWKEVVKK